MGELFNSLSLMPRGLRHKLMAAFVLMAVIPLLICVYFVSNYILPYVETIWDIGLVILFTIIVALLGLVLARGIVEPIIKLAVEAELIANGDLGRKIEVTREDEIGSVEKSLNLMAKKLRENMAEIQSYGERIKTINIDINKRVMALSGLIQIGNLMSATPEMKLDAVIPLIMERLANIAETKKIFIMVLDPKTNELVAEYGHNMEPEAMEKIRTRLGKGFIGKAAVGGERLVVDNSKVLTRLEKEFGQQHEMRNLCLIPVSSLGKVVGLVGLGNDLADYTYRADDLELLNIFTRQVAVAIEMGQLIKRTKELEIQDELTGLHNEKYMKQRLSEEIKRAIMYQRPCSLIIFNLDDFKKYQQDNSELIGAEALKQVAEILKKSTEEIEKIGRTGGDNFMAILPEKNKGEAKDVAEKIRKRVEKFSFQGAKTQPSGRLTISAGVSANPIDGITTEDLLNKALVQLLKAKKEGKNRVMV